MKQFLSRYGVVIVIVVIFGVLYFGKDVVDRINQSNETAQVEAEARKVAIERYGDAVAGRCKEIPVQNGEFPAFEGIPRLAVLNAGSDTLNDWADALPENWATATDMIDFIICVDLGAPPEDAGSCPMRAVSSDGSTRDFDLPMVQTAAEIIILNAQGDRVLGRTIVYGALPECPGIVGNTAFAVSYGPGDTVYGLQPGVDTFTG